MPQPSVLGVRHFIYPLTATSGYSLVGGSKITPANYWRGAVKGRSDEWGLSSGYRLIEPGDWVWAYFGGAVRQICGVGTVRSPVSWRRDWERHAVLIEWNAALTKRLQTNPIRYDEYRQPVQAAAVRANPATRRVLNRWLSGEGVAIAARAKEVQFVKRTMHQRLGQAGFRADVLAALRGSMRNHWLQGAGRARGSPHSASGSEGRALAGQQRVASFRSS